MKYLVSRQGQEMGPFALGEIVAKVRGKELDLFDFIFDESKQDWVLLMEHSELAQKLKSNKPPRPPQSTGDTAVQPIPVASTAATGGATTATATATPSSQNPHSITEWFVLKGENKFGPFSFNDVIKMLQQKVVFPFDFIWHSGLEGWNRVAELQEFNEENIRKLYSTTGTGKNNVFVERQFARKKFEGRVIVHDNLTLWKGQGFEISKGGVGITMKNSLVVPGQQVFVHFRGEDSFPAFNAICEVVSKKFVNNDSPIQYGLRFLSLTQEVQDEFNKRVA